MRSQPLHGAEGRMIPPENLTRWHEITARLEELSKLDILDFWEEVQKLEREKADLDRDAA